MNLLIVPDALDGGISGDERRLGLLDGLVQVPQVTPFRLPDQTCAPCQPKMVSSVSLQLFFAPGKSKPQTEIAESYSSRTVFVDGRVVVVARRDERATGGPVEVCAPMVLKDRANVRCHYNRKAKHPGDNMW